MQSFSQENCDKLMRARIINIHDYASLKKYFRSLGEKSSLTSKRKSKQKKDLIKIWNDHNFDEELKPLFLSNIYITNETEFLYAVEEALSFGCKKEDVPNYIKANYGIPKAAYKLKISEMRVYREYYKVYTNIYSQVERVLAKTDTPKEIRTRSYKALGKELSKLEETKVTNINELKERQKVYYFDENSKEVA